jgi:lia operon protein LiaG
MSRMAKLVLILIIVMVASFVIAGVIFYADYGANNFAAFSDGIKPGNAINVDEQKTAQTTGLKTLVIDTSSDDVNFITSDTDEIKAHYHGYYSSSDKSFKPEFTLTTSGDTTTIKIEYQSHIGTLMFSSNLKLDVYIPQSYSSNLQVRTSSGNVKAEVLKLESFICRTTSGDFAAKTVNASKAQLESTSGNMSINGLFDSFKFRSTSGDFTTDGITAKAADLSSTSGNIRLNISGDELNIHSTSGDITSDSMDIKNCKLETNSGTIRLKGNPGNLEAKSTSGDINAEYTGFASNINVRTTSGRTSIKLPTDAEFRLSFKTNSGNSNCAFPVTVNNAGERKGLEGTVVSDKNSITVNSTSGDLNISK